MKTDSKLWMGGNSSTNETLDSQLFLVAPLPSKGLKVSFRHLLLLLLLMLSIISLMDVPTRRRTLQLALINTVLASV